MRVIHWFYPGTKLAIHDDGVGKEMSRRDFPRSYCCWLIGEGGDVAGLCGPSSTLSYWDYRFLNLEKLRRSYSNFLCPWLSSGVSRNGCIGWSPNLVVESLCESRSKMLRCSDARSHFLVTLILHSVAMIESTRTQPPLVVFRANFRNLHGVLMCRERRCRHKCFDCFSSLL